jgi:isopenicillin N synthase-like dioxygenase
VSVPVIDMTPLFGVDERARGDTAARIAGACEDDGFFQVIGHGVSPRTIATLAFQASTFFALPAAEKARIGMARGGAAWRGWFPLGGELTSGHPDDKEGIYFGEELPPEDPRVAAGWPLHGANLWPAAVPGLRPAVEAYMAACAHAADVLMEGVSLALGLEARYFARAHLGRPTQLFRIFRYPPTSPGAWGVGEHTDYGLLTLLAQDDVGGLEVKARSGWIAAPPIPGALVCNIGDMLERLTRGRFVSTPHRVVNRTGRERLSFPFFYDPDFAARMDPIPAPACRRDTGARWDGADVHAYDGVYGDYLLAKISRVFPDLKGATLGA